MIKSQLRQRLEEQKSTLKLLRPHKNISLKYTEMKRVTGQLEEVKCLYLTCLSFFC